MHSLAAATNDRHNKRSSEYKQTDPWGSHLGHHGRGTAVSPHRWSFIIRNAVMVLKQISWQPAVKLWNKPLLSDLFFIWQVPALLGTGLEVRMNVEGTVKWWWKGKECFVYQLPSLTLKLNVPIKLFITTALLSLHPGGETRGEKRCVYLKCGSNILVWVNQKCQRHGFFHQKCGECITQIVLTPHICASRLFCRGLLHAGRAIQGENTL